MTDMTEAREVIKEICIILEQMTEEQKLRAKDIIAGIALAMPTAKTTDGEGEKER